MIFIEYPKCSTCAKYKKELTDGGLQFETRHIVEDNPSYEEVQGFHEKSGADIKKFFNTSGMKYRELQLKDKLPTMSLEEKYTLLASDGMLIKRPILVTDQSVLLGKDVLKAL
ncbi:MAG: arsenate reductase family protein [Eubacteriales bacterium]